MGGRRILYLDFDTTDQANLIKKFIDENLAKVCPNPKSKAEAFRKYKTWIVLYFQL
jgi:hypothetical protein